MTVEIGEWIKKQLKDQGLSYKDLGVLINRHEKTVAGILKRKTIDTELLLSISKALNHDFFKYYYEKDPLLSLRQLELSHLHNEIDSLKNELAEKINFISIQNKYVDSQEDVIRLLKEKEVFLKN